MKILTPFLLLAALASGQQSNSPTATLMCMDPAEPTTSITLQISGLPNQAWYLFVSPGGPAWGSYISGAGSLDLQYWLGLAIPAQGNTGPTGVVLISGALPPGYYATIQAVVFDPFFSSAGMTLTASMTIDTP
jgi:hypothetical protein